MGLLERVYYAPYTAPYFIILFCLTPDDFTRQGDAGTQWRQTRQVTVYIADVFWGLYFSINLIRLP
jgi:hypothetical protein